MRLRYGNSFSISLWNEEIEEVQILDSIVYKTPSGKKVIIRVPTSWLQLDSKSDDEDSKTKDDKSLLNSECLVPRRQEEIVNEQDQKKGLDIKAIDEEVAKLKSMLEDFKFQIGADLKKSEENFIKVNEEQNKHRKEIKEAWKDIIEVKKDIDSICADLDDNHEWRLTIEEFLRIDTMRGPPENDPKSRRKGKSRYR